MAHSKALKEQEKMEKKLLNDYYEKRAEIFEESEKVRAKEISDRNKEYRDFLLMQINDKEKLKQKEKASSQKPYVNVELADAIEKHTLKVLKQGEERKGLDECVKMKNDLKHKNERRDVRENQMMEESCEKRDYDTSINQERVKNKAENKEQRNDGVALQWTAQKDNDIMTRNIHRDEVANTLIENEMMKLGEECPSDLYEMRENIRIKQELLRQLDEKLANFNGNLEEAKIMQHQLMLEIAEEEEKLGQDLKENSRQKYLLHDTMSQNSHHGKSGNEIKEVIWNYRKQRTQNN